MGVEERKGKKERSINWLWKIHDNKGIILTSTKLQLYSQVWTLIRIIPHSYIKLPLLYYQINKYSMRDKDTNRYLTYANSSRIWLMHLNEWETHQVWEAQLRYQLLLRSLGWRGNQASAQGLTYYFVRDWLLCHNYTHLCYTSTLFQIYNEYVHVSWKYNKFRTVNLKLKGNRNNLEDFNIPKLTQQETNEIYND